MKTQSKSEAGVSAGANDRRVVGRTSVRAPEEATTPANKKVVGNQSKVAVATKATKAARRPSRSARVTSKTKKLACRYCRSDDLAPSFLKRRDARCRTCFQQRYGSVARDKKASRPRKAKTAK
jgi:hypothetical protein